LQRIKVNERFIGTLFAKRVALLLPLKWMALNRVLQRPAGAE
jgi:hypothetical protein